MRAQDFREDLHGFWKLLVTTEEIATPERTAWIIQSATISYRGGKGGHPARAQNCTNRLTADRMAAEYVADLLPARTARR